MKIFLMSVFSVLLTYSGFAKPKPDLETMNKPKIQIQSKIILNDNSFGRECCEAGAYDSNGNYVVVEACAGWFLSNSANAHERACDKALAALSAIIENP